MNWSTGPLRACIGRLLRLLCRHPTEQMPQKGDRTDRNCGSEEILTVVWQGNYNKFAEPYDSWFTSKQSSAAIFRSEVQSFSYRSDTIKMNKYFFFQLQLGLRSLSQLDLIMLFGEVHVAYCGLLFSLVSLDSILDFVEIFYSAMLTVLT